VIIYESERQHRQIIIESECYAEYVAAVIAYNTRIDAVAATINKLKEEHFEMMKCLENDLVAVMMRGNSTKLGLENT